MTNISFDNPYLLLLFIPLALLVTLPYIFIRNKDNRSVGWTVSLALHLLVALIISLAAAGMSSTRLLTKTTVYVVADVSYSADRSHEEIDGYISEIEKSLPENATLGIVCFGKDYSILTAPGREIKSVSEAKVDESATDIAGALTYTAGLFKGDSLKRIVLITDGNDTESESVSSIAQAVENITENGIRIDAIFLDTSLGEDDGELQLLSVEHSETSYLNHQSEVKLTVRASKTADTVITLYSRPIGTDGNPIGEYAEIGESILTSDEGLNTVRMALPTDIEGSYEYKAVVSSSDDYSEYNNERTFTQRVVGKKKILLVTGNYSDEALLSSAYGESADIDTYLVPGRTVPVNISEIIEYDEIVISDLDIRAVCAFHKAEACAAVGICRQCGRHQKHRRQAPRKQPLCGIAHSSLAAHSHAKNAADLAQMPCRGGDLLGGGGKLLGLLFLHRLLQRLFPKLHIQIFHTIPSFPSISNSFFLPRSTRVYTVFSGTSKRAATSFTDFSIT
jgi:hypothetical protein